MKIGPGSHALLARRRERLNAMFSEARSAPDEMLFVGGSVHVQGRQPVGQDGSSPGQSMGLRILPIGSDLQCRAMLRHVENYAVDGSNALSRRISESLMRYAERRLNVEASSQTRSPVREMRSGGR